MQRRGAHRADIYVSGPLLQFIEDEALPAAGVDPAPFWSGFASIIRDLTPWNSQLLARREELQSLIDEWHLDNRGGHADVSAYEAFLRTIGYVEPEGEPFTISPGDVDEEVATIAGPQLVVPASNARFALNAVNARWGSLYDALYGTDALGSPPPRGPYDPERGAEVIRWVNAFLDRTVPLEGASHCEVGNYVISEHGLSARVPGGVDTTLQDPAQFVGYGGDRDDPSTIVLRHNGLHLQLTFDRADPVGATDPAGRADVLLEAATTVIIDCEDSVAAVDADDKVAAYRTWLGLNRGDLRADVPLPDGRTTIRRPAHDRIVRRADGSDIRLAGRSLMFVRNVGHLMTTDAVLDSSGHEVPEGIVDAVVTVLCALSSGRHGSPPNSTSGAVYVVKPKIHGPEEAKFANELFRRVEELFGLETNQIKVGLMDEERRTSVNLGECVRALRNRIVFVNTGFLDRTGDEIHTSMRAGPMVPKSMMREQRWFIAYEQRNVAIALGAGFRGTAQIGKGMWAAPDQMSAMLDQKIAHLDAGATCAWVPSPTAATLHATHYHDVDVTAIQEAMEGVAPLGLADLLTIPVTEVDELGTDVRRRDVDNNVQSILGYVVRWVDQGIGCSKVPDIDDVALMEDRATCRISSQHVANWLAHGVVSRSDVEDSLCRMARVVDDQNAGDPLYSPMAPSFDGPAFLAASELIFNGHLQPAGYTEPILHARRLDAKAQARHA